MTALHGSPAVNLILGISSVQPGEISPLYHPSACTKGGLETMKGLFTPFNALPASSLHACWPVVATCVSSSPFHRQGRTPALISAANIHSSFHSILTRSAFIIHMGTAAGYDPWRKFSFISPVGSPSHNLASRSGVPSPSIHKVKKLATAIPRDASRVYRRASQTSSGLAFPFVWHCHREASPMTESLDSSTLPWPKSMVSINDSAMLVQPIQGETARGGGWLRRPSCLNRADKAFAEGISYPQLQTPPPDKNSIWANTVLCIGAPLANLDVLSLEHLLRGTDTDDIVLLRP